ncbi:hypothetical protein [Marinomonas balearica]|uniref:Uncharacterized protein n=1 Tax=Marinomonas balearica TaxID=491947 RepID=A0A4R6M532_9GAMM|nr:hypothetical protein [Marinomonas balearica]TDO95855.1 hypothetical protein DFP79_3213 [Marinomonas balearica]
MKHVLPNVSTLLPNALLMLVGVCCLVSSMVSMKVHALEAQGLAFDPKTKALLYTERHFFSSPMIHEVRYFEPDGSLFTLKRLDYSQSLIAPDLEQLNQRQGEKISVKLKDKIVLSYKANSKEKPKETVFNPSNQLVIDAGFDRYIRQNWADLTAHSARSVMYLVPSRHTTVEFKIQRKTCLAAQEPSFVCFVVKPNAWWLSLLIDPLLLTYDATNKQLMRFVGRGNIADKKGKYQTVDIRYTYFE